MLIFKIQCYFFEGQTERLKTAIDVISPLYLLSLKPLKR